jgi:L-asparaginase
LSSVFSATLPSAAKVVVLGTGGTIAGTGQDASRPWHYQAAQLGVDSLLAGVPAALARHLADPDVLGVVITHGTDTLEETAALLHWLAPQGKPMVLTAAMRPATAPDADGPANLADAVATVLHAHSQGASGVVAVMQGRVWAGSHVRKAHSHAMDAFDGGGEPPLMVAVDGQGLTDADAAWRMASWLPTLGLGWGVLAAPLAHVPLITSHAGADGLLVQALMAQEATCPQGILLACTGHGTVHEALAAALQAAEQKGVVVWRSSRVARGGVTPRPDDTWPATGHWTAAQARLGLQLRLMGAALDLSA